MQSVKCYLQPLFKTMFIYNPVYHSKFKVLKFLLRVILPRQHSKLKNALHLHTKIKKENNDSHISPIVPERRPSQNKKGNYLGDRPHEIIFKQVHLETVELNKNFLNFIPNIFVLCTISIQQYHLNGSFGFCKQSTELIEKHLCFGHHQHKMSLNASFGFW